jgi:type VI secretion system protein ImpC
MPQANYIGLTVPRFMLRWPYGAATEPIESFAFEEFTPQAGLRGMLWANGSILAGLLLGKTFSEQGLARMKLGSQMTLGDVPFYYYTDPDGDQIALPSTERMVSEPTAVRIMSQNFMPVLSIRGRSEVRLGSFNSLSGALLAGPWAPLDIKPDEGQLPSANASSTPTDDDSTSIEELEARAAVEAEQELDALLADDSPVLASADAELDAALASMAENASDTSSTNENEMDTSLADLLSKL